jgi:hypothetical protein
MGMSGCPAGNALVSSIGERCRSLSISRDFRVFWVLPPLGLENSSHPPRRLLRCDYHDHLPSLEPRKGLDLGDLRGVTLDPIEHVHAQFLMRHLTTPKSKRDLDFVTLVQEFVNTAHFYLIVILVDVWTKLDLFDLDHSLLFLRLVLLLLGFVFELPIIEDLANRRVGIGRDLDQVETMTFRLGDRVNSLHHSKLFPVRGDTADLFGSDVSVHPRANFDRLMIKWCPGDLTPPLSICVLKISFRGQYSHVGGAASLRSL